MNTNRYTSKDVQTLFGVSHSTVQNWAIAYSEVLSVGATPPSGSTRVFEESDLAVFALAAEMKQRKATNAETLLALRAGQRGEIPNPSALDKLPAGVQSMIVRMRDEMDTLRQQIKALESDRDKAVGKVELLTQQLADKEAENKAMLRQLARMETDQD